MVLPAGLPNPTSGSPQANLVCLLFLRKALSPVVKRKEHPRLRSPAGTIGPPLDNRSERLAQTRIVRLKSPALRRSRSPQKADRAEQLRPHPLEHLLRSRTKHQV